MHMLRICVGLLALGLLTPLASAHNEVDSTDGKYQFVIGQLNEPVVTYAKTGLDLCIKQMPSNHEELEAMGEEVEGAAVNVDVGGLTATLKSPDGKIYTEALKSQFGRVGCYQFLNPYILTQPGQYTVDLTGSVNGTVVDFKAVKAGGVVGNSSTLTFPADSVPALESVASQSSATASEVAKLRQDVASLQSQVASLKAAQTTKGAPGPAPVLLVGAILGVAALAAWRRRQG